MLDFFVMMDSMTTMHDEFAALASAVKRRRIELNYTQQQAVDASGGRLSLASWSKLEAGQAGNYRDLTSRGIEAGLRWPSGTVPDILAGNISVDDAVLLKPVTPADDPSSERLDRVERILVAVAEKLGIDVDANDLR